MSKSRNNHKWFDEDDLEYERTEIYIKGKKKRGDRFEEITQRREQKNRAKSNTFTTNDDWD